MRWGPFCVLMFLLPASGCLGGTNGAEDTGLGSDEGTLSGSVTDDEIVPLPGALVQLRTIRFSPIKIEAVTKADGSFRFEEVPAGKHTMTVKKSGYEEHEATVVVEAARTTNVTIRLVPIPLSDYRILTLAALEGAYECALAHPQGSGSCDDALEGPTGQDVVQEKNNHTLLVPRGWDGLLVEVAWTATQETSAIDGFRFRLEAENGSGAYAVASASRSPLRIALNAGERHPGAEKNLTLPTTGGTTFLQLVTEALSVYGA